MLTELGHLLTDPSHWLFEAITDALFAGVGVAWHAAWQRRHDREHHGGR